MIDYYAQDERLQKNLISGVSGLFPIQGRENTLELIDVSIDMPFGDDDLGEQKKIKLKNRTFAGSMHGSFVLKNIDGKVIDRQKVKIMDVPIMTERATYIIKGTEYNVPYQLRIRPGVYSRVQDDGNLTAFVNLSKGHNFKLMLDDEDEKFYLLYKNNTIPLYPILTALGKTRTEIERFWGKELTDINSAAKHEDAIKKLYGKMGGDTNASLTEMQAGIETVFDTTQIDKDTTKKTLGKSFSKVDANMLMASSQKLLKIKQGLDKPDSRDSLQFKSLHGLDDFISERIRKQTYKIKRSVLNRIDNHNKIKAIMSVSTVNDPINSFFHDGAIAIAGTPKQSNPISITNEMQKITLSGAGGITNPETVTDEARAVHPSSMGLIDPMHTPESQMIGLTLHMPLAASKDGDKLVTTAHNIKTGKEEKIDAAIIENNTISFADEYNRKNGKYIPKGKKVRAYSSTGKAKYVDSADVDYIAADGKMLFSWATNLIPFLSSNHPNRGMTGAKMISQALPLVDPDAPSVRPTILDKSVHKILGDSIVAKSSKPGVVKKITDSEIIVKHDDGDKSYQYYNNFPLNEGHFYDDKVVVNVGDKVKKNQRLTENMFTDDGILAYGKNLKIGYMAPRGLTFEDAIAISDSAAEKLTSRHMYKVSIEINKGTALGLKRFRLYAPTELSSANAGKLDEDGVITNGSVVEPGDIIFAGLKKMIKTPDEEIIGRFSKKIKPYRKYTKEWEKDFFGKVTDVVKTPKEITIYITTEERAQIGDKLVGSFGNKGVISEILPSHDMPIDKEGESLEIIMNPLVIPSRINPAQLLETAAGKISDKTGKPYEIENFSGVDYLAKIQKDMKALGITDKEDLIDPNTNRSLGNVMIGKQYIMKLDHNVAKKLSARGPLGEATYTDDLSPTSGKGTGGLREDALTVYSMLSHGARENLKEMQSDKGEKNDEFWMALESGLPLPKQKPTFAWMKFINMLKASGIDVKEDGNRVQLLPLTDNQINAVTNGEIKKEDMIRAKNLAPIKGGLFDKELTGGVGGKKWTHINLDEPILNPIFTKPVRILLNLTSNDIDNIIYGNLYIDDKGSKVSKDAPGSMTGNKAIGAALKKVDVGGEISKATEEIKSADGNKLDKLHRKIRYLKNLQKMNEKADVFMVKKVPVLPPVFRPIYPLPDGNLRVSDLNVPYKDLVTINNQIKDAKKIGLPDEQMKAARGELFEAYKALTGLSSPVTRKEFKGVLESVAGAQPKTGYFQSRIMSKRQELTGRSTVIPSPNLDMDEIEIPKEILWTLYKPFIKRRLKAQGYTLLRANEEIENKTKSALLALQSELEQRPIMMNRAPSLHKFSIMSFFPKMSSKKAIGVNPFVTAGFNMDFDGDAVALHVPIREAARKESYRMLPSANLFSPMDNSLVHKPEMEIIVGLNLLTREGKNTQKKFTSQKMALDAYANKLLGMNDMITVEGKRTNIGRILLNSKLPVGLKIDSEMTKKTMDEYLSRVAKDSPQNYAQTIGILRDMGHDHVYKMGFTIGLSDLIIDEKKKKSIFAEAEKSIKSGKSDEEVIKEYGKAMKKINMMIDSLPKSNSFKLMMDSGSKGNINQIRQVIAAPTLVQDMDENPVPLPITSSYARGLTTGEYFAVQDGARRTMMDRALQTKWPGALTKELVNATASQVITMIDCGTRKGVPLRVGDDNTLDRYVAKDPSGTLKYNDLVDSNSRAKLISKKVKEIIVRSPLTCEASHGICSKCFGIDEFGGDINVGDNIGVKAAQTLSEPNTSMSMKTFHTGGTSGDDQSVTQGFWRIQDILHLRNNLPNKGIIAKESGLVRSVTASPSGGFIVFIGEERHVIPPGRTSIVRVGDNVHAGDPLSSGPLKPQEISDYKGVEKAQEYIINELDKTYRDNGVKVKRKMFETVVKPMTTTARITDPGESDFVKGDFLNVNIINEINSGLRDKIQYESVLIGINTVPLYTEDWLGRMNATRLKDTLMEGTAQGFVSEISPLKSPLATHAYGIDKKLY